MTDQEEKMENRTDSPADQQADVDHQAGGLGALGRKHGVAFGAAAHAGALREDKAYGPVLAREFTMLVAENAMKMGPTYRGPKSWDFRAADRVAEFARKHNQPMRGHTLLWHAMNPAWILHGDFTRKKLLDLAHDHIFEIVPRYKDVITCWDAVNETVERTDGGWHDTFWLRGVGADHIDFAFRWAHQADPDCKLFFNDWVGEGEGAPRTIVHDAIRAALDRHVPIHGVGLQMHLKIDEMPEFEDIEAALDRFERLGIEIHITELDIVIPTLPTDAMLEAQAKAYGKFARIAREHKNVTALVLWGFTDKWSCHNSTPVPYQHGLLFDEEYRKKPAYEAVHEAWR